MQCKRNCISALECTAYNTSIPSKETMTKFFYDTEFHEDGKTIDFMSIGIVNYDTKETFYAVSCEFDTSRVCQNWWLMKNVMSSIEHKTFTYYDFDGAPCYRDFILTDKNAMSRDAIRDGILNFIGDQQAELWAWYSAYDHVCLAQLFGKMIDLPETVPMVTYDIKQVHKEAGYPEMPQQPEGLHNALEDAKMNVVRYDYLKGLIDGKS